jgi:hypothetical protein
MRKIKTGNTGNRHRKVHILTALFLCVVLVTSFAACGNNNPAPNNDSGATSSNQTGTPAYGGSATFLIDQMFNYFDAGLNDKCESK